MHKKACKKRAAELHDEKLFKEPPPREECLICFLPLPLDTDQIDFKSCCGKPICGGCTYAMIETAKTNKQKRLCAFCRTPPPADEEEIVKRIMKLMEKSNAHAIFELAGYYERGTYGELWMKAGELGRDDAYINLGNSYHSGSGVEIDMKKAKYYYELAAMNGAVYARHNIGALEGQAGNIHRATKHFILAARAGSKPSLDDVKRGYKHGVVTKDEYASALRSYQKSQDEMKSEARDKAEQLLHTQRIRNG